MNTEVNDIIDCIKLIYVVHTTVDERGKLGKLLGVSFHEETAKTIANGKGWYGGDGRIIKKYAIENESGIFVLESDRPVSEGLVYRERLTTAMIVARQALAKLTEEEKVALGLEEYVATSIPATTQDMVDHAKRN